MGPQSPAPLSAQDQWALQSEQRLERLETVSCPTQHQSFLAKDCYEPLKTFWPEKIRFPFSLSKPAGSQSILHSDPDQASLDGESGEGQLAKKYKETSFIKIKVLKPTIDSCNTSLDLWYKDNKTVLPSVPAVHHLEHLPPLRPELPASLDLSQREHLQHPQVRRQRQAFNSTTSLINYVLQRFFSLEQGSSLWASTVNRDDIIIEGTSDLNLRCSPSCSPVPCPSSSSSYSGPIVGGGPSWSWPSWQGSNSACLSYTSLQSSRASL